MVFYKLVVKSVHVIDHESVSDIVHKTQPKYPDHKFEKLVVIFLTDAVI